VAFARPIPGEIARRRRPDGGLSIVLTRPSDAAWPSAAEAMSLEDMFIELTDVPGAEWFAK